MKKHQTGFAAGVLVTIIAFIAAVGGGYYFLQTEKAQISESSKIPDYNTVNDFESCMRYAKDQPISFDIVFETGSNRQSLGNFQDDFLKAYSRAELEFSDEQDYVNRAVELYGHKTGADVSLADYQSALRAKAISTISVRVPVRDLGTLSDFQRFMDTTLKKYPDIKFRQYAGSSPETVLSGGSVSAMREMFEKQCDYKYKQLNTSEREALELRNYDARLGGMISSANITASMYYEKYHSYSSSSTVSNGGICTDTGTYGLKKTIDSIKEFAGEVYCSASAKAFAISAPLKSDPLIGYCADSTTFAGTTTSPNAAIKGTCKAPQQVSQDISSCKNGASARQRWSCAGNIVDQLSRIRTIVMPYATPVSEKIVFCKGYTGIEADYCFSSIVKAGWGLDYEGPYSPAGVCSLVSNKNSWFKADCINAD